MTIKKHANNTDSARTGPVRYSIFSITLRSSKCDCLVCFATSPSDDSSDASRRRRRRCFTEDYGAATFAVDVLLFIVSIGYRRVSGQMQVQRRTCRLLSPGTGLDT